MSTLRARDVAVGVVGTASISPSGATPDVLLTELRVLRDDHPLWRCRLLRAFENGSLEKSDLQYVFSQYQHYSRSFTRFISAVMANCDHDLWRARLSENLWEEGGGCDPDRRHAEIFRRFLRDALDVPAPEDVEYAAFTRHFVREYLTACLGGDVLSGAAFLSLGTESIVPRLYEVFVTGLRKAGFRDEQLEFFHLHIACDDEHAETLEQMMLSYASEPRWFDICKRAMKHALDLRLEFFERLVEELQRRRLDSTIAAVNAGRSLCSPDAKPSDVRHRGGDEGPALYANAVDSEGIEFVVTRIPLEAEVLDPRRVAIPPGKANERHRHAHETFIHVISGAGHVEVDAQIVDVKAGDSVLVPRWALHQTRNTGGAPLEFIAVTDYRLTKRAYVGDAKAYRLDERANRHRDE